MDEEGPAETNQRYAVGLARAFGGAVIFAFPLMMTLEMWSLGVSVGRGRLLLFITANFAKGKLSEAKPVTDREHKKLYNLLTYSIIVRTLIELAAMPLAEVIDSIAVNAVCFYKSPATGKDTRAVIASVLASVPIIKDLDYQHLDPEETFRLLKGVSAAALSDVVPVVPIIEFDKADKRFVEGREVIDGLEVGANLASVGWEDFEHLVRQLFERLFRDRGADVRITRSSRDKGVDAVVFDPDPITGGKIIIQAKRYTNTVDVSSVRDLFGTVQNESANRGILVTTSQFGGDSYEFAKDKNLTLIDGQRLLGLFEQQGMKFRIDLPEAKRMGASAQRR